MKIIVLLLFVSKAFSSIQTTKSSDEYDVTNALNDSIVRIFQTVEPQNIIKLIDSFVYSDLVKDFYVSPYKYSYIWSNGHNTSVWFLNIRLANVSSKNSYVSSKFLNNEMQLFSPQLIVHLFGTIYLSDSFNYAFNSVAHFNGYTITAFRQPNNSDKLFIDSQHDHADIKLEIPGAPVWLKNVLLGNCERLLPSILRTHMNRNEKLKNAFREILDHQSTKQIILKHPHFLGHEHLYHYLIPNVTIGCFNSKDIVVRGLWNHHSLNYTLNNDIVTHRLLMKDIRGSMILEDVSSTTMSSLKCHYSVDSLSIFVTQEINRISVKAENYSIIETKSNTSLTKLQSDILIDQIERAIGTSLMPSMEYQRINRPIIFPNIHDQEIFIRQNLIEIFTHFDTPTASTKKPYENSTIIGGSTYTTNQIRSKDEKITNINNYHYHISIGEMTINLLSGNPEYSDGIQCPFPTNSKFTHRMNISPTGKINSKTNETDAIGVNFHFHYPSVNLSSIKSKNSEKNGSCEFQIGNNRDIRVELSPSTHNTSESNVQLLMKKKIEASLISMTKDRIIRTVKPIVCKPFDVCMQTSKMIDDFFLKFIDIVLKKCSFRKTTT